MSMFKRRSLSLALGLLAAAGSCCAGALSFTGTFDFDSDTFITTISTVGPQTEFFVSTLGYGGGTNTADQSIPAGGFAPALALFDPSGNLVDYDFTGGTAVGSGCSNGTNQYLGLCQDGTLDFSTAVTGTYTLVLTEWSNAPNDSTLGAYESDLLPAHTNLTTPPFQDFLGDQLNGNWALDVTADALPEPATASLVLIGLGAVAAWRKRRS